LAFALVEAISFASFGSPHLTGATDSNPNQQPTFKEK
jgi:hypothetical protein